MNKESEIRELICKYDIDIENEHEFIEELKLINKAAVAEITEELKTTDNLLEERQRVLDAIPECDSHGGNCVPNALDWIEAAKKLISPTNKPKKRYFIVSYNQASGNVMTIGRCEVINDLGEFPSRKDIKSNLERTSQSNIVVTNIIELNESDYKDWVS